MPRTLPAALTAVMDSGNFEPYIMLALNSAPSSMDEFNVQPISYKLEPLQATAKIYLVDPSIDTSYFRLIRGALINGTPVTISSIWFKTVEQSFDGKYVYLIGEPFTRSYQVVDPGSTYQEVIEFVGGQAGEFVNTDEFIYEGVAAWKDYQFYPTGRNIVISPAKKLFTLLQQKYLVFATEDGWDGTNNVQGDLFFFCATDTRAPDYTFTDFLLTTTSRSEKRRLIARDENNTVRSTGLDTSIVHNLGFLHSTAAFPTNAECGSIGSGTKKTHIHLKYRTGDYVTILGAANQFTGRIKVTEVFDTNSTPAWYQIIEKLEWFSTTEGGAMPSTIEAAAPYTPLVTGRFDNILSTADNNLQAAMETLDDHTHPGGASIWGAITGTLTDQTDLDAALDGKSDTGHTHAAYLTDAPSDGKTYGRKNGAWAEAAGVTDHTALSNIGTNTHAQIDTHLASTSNPHSTSDANLTVTDVTTNDVSTAKHGFAPKAPNDAAKFLNGTGAWSAPTSGGAAPHLPGGRLTLTSGTPLIITDQTAKTNIYYTPFSGDLVPLYNGTGWTMTAFTELTLALDSNNGHTGYHQSGKIFDLFAYLDGSTLRLVSGPSWTNDTTRATALAYKNGILMNAASMTARYGSASGDTVTVAQDRGVFLGSFRASTNGQVEDSYVKRFLWNLYNQVLKECYVLETTLHNYNNPAALRKWNNSDTNNLIGFIVGRPQVVYIGLGNAIFAGVAGAYATTVIYIDGAGLHAGIIQTFNYNPYYLGGGTSAGASVADGYHYVQLYEIGNNNNSTFAWMWLTAQVLG